jgi:hypothetical protein
VRSARIAFLAPSRLNTSARVALPPARRPRRAVRPPPALTARRLRPARPAGKAAWIAGTAFLILVVPLIIEMDREQQLVEFESGQLGALTGAPAAGAAQ